ncbi:MAG: DUF167 domain-containing protein [Planctomycetales bacterium]|nr:DUF167 domain-containing protein [Planctomycetales bacterium]
MVDLREHARGVVLPVRAKAGAKRNAVLGVRGGALLVSVTQAPERGKANQAILKQLAELFAVRASEVELLSGQTSPQKQFLLVGASLAAVRRVTSACGEA